MDGKEYLEKWWMKYNNDLSRDAITKLWNRAQESERTECAEIAEAALSDANKYDIADAIRMRSNVS